MILRNNLNYSIKVILFERPYKHIQYYVTEKILYTQDILHIFDTIKEVNDFLNKNFNWNIKKISIKNNVKLKSLINKHNIEKY